MLVPRAAFNELGNRLAPQKVLDWTANLPSWIEIRSAPSVLAPALDKLDLGEREAIQLALALGLDTVLMDESEGRRVAESLGLEVRGTLGILERAARLGKIDFRIALSKLDRTNFRLSPQVRLAFLNRNP